MRRRPASWWAGVFAFVWVIGVEQATISHEPKQACGTICFTLVQARAYAEGRDPWSSGGDPAAVAALNHQHPSCPVVGPSLYTPAYLWLLGPLSTRITAVCSVWPQVQLAAYAFALAAAASLLSGWRRVAMLLSVLIVRSALAAPFQVQWATVSLVDPFNVDYASGQTGSIEAAAVWAIAVLGARSRWWASAAVAFLIGIPKQVHWALVTLPILAKRWQVSMAGLIAVGLLNVLTFKLDGRGYQEALSQALGHDERGVIHPSLRSLVRDWMDSAASGTHRADLPWLATCAVVGVGLIWWSRREPARVASAEGMLLCVLTYLALTPYLKDYTLVAAVPAVASVVATAPLWGFAAIAAVHFTVGTLGGYHALAVIWTAWIVHALAMRSRIPSCAPGAS